MARATPVSTRIASAGPGPASPASRACSSSSSARVVSDTAANCTPMRTSHASTVVDRDAIAATETLIRPHIRRTPVVEVAGEDLGLHAARVTLKLELTQRAGSFKARGAFANLLLRDVPAAG